MISAALAILETEEERSELSLIYERNIKKFYSIAFPNYTISRMPRMHYRMPFWQ